MKKIRVLSEPLRLDRIIVGRIRIFPLFPHPINNMKESQAETAEEQPNHNASSQTQALPFC